jgi:hypothetical protein
MVRTPKGDIGAESTHNSLDSIRVLREPLVVHGALSGDDAEEEEGDEYTNFNCTDGALNIDDGHG